MKILGYYQDYDTDRLIPSNVFVAVQELDNGKVEVYCPVGQHSEASLDYVRSCESITREQYLEASEGLWTPAEYVVDYYGGEGNEE
jgi:hypothetical protein